MEDIGEKDARLAGLRVNVPHSSEIRGNAGGFTAADPDSPV